MPAPHPSSLLPALPPDSAVLIARLRSLGDLVLETPAIACLHAWRPDLRISVLVEPRYAAALEGNPAVSELLFSRGLLESARGLRRRRFPVMFNHHGGPRSALLTAASGSRWRVGWKGYQFSFAYNVLVPDKQEFYGACERHTVEHRISQFYWTGLPPGPIARAQVFPQPDAAAAVRQMLREKGITPGAYAVLQPGARLPSMRWPAQNFAEIARWLLRNYGIPSIVNLGADDREIVQETRRRMRDCAHVPEPLDLRQLIALLAGACLFVGNDSGPAHVAAAAGRPCVVIFGATNPVEWRPWQTEHRIVDTGAVFRSLRGDKSVAVSQSRSVDSIPVDEVRQSCAELLAGRPTH